jgi:uncharacterized protein with HEPN domain
MTFEQLVQDRRTIDAVVRNLIVISEAAGHIPEEVRASTPEIPWDDMRALRNFVVHEYFGVSEKVLWETVRQDLPSVTEPLQRVLSGFH